MRELGRGQRLVAALGPEIEELARNQLSEIAPIKASLDSAEITPLLLLGWLILNSAKGEETAAAALTLQRISHVWRKPALDILMATRTGPTRELAVTAGLLSEPEGQQEKDKVVELPAPLSRWVSPAATAMCVRRGLPPTEAASSVAREILSVTMLQEKALQAFIAPNDSSVPRNVDVPPDFYKILDNRMSLNELLTRCSGLNVGCGELQAALVDTTTLTTALGEALLSAELLNNVELINADVTQLLHSSMKGGAVSHLDTVQEQEKQQEKRNEVQNEQENVVMAAEPLDPTGMTPWRLSDLCLSPFSTPAAASGAQEEEEFIPDEMPIFRFCSEDELRALLDDRDMKHDHLTAKAELIGECRKKWNIQPKSKRAQLNRDSKLKVSWVAMNSFIARDTAVSLPVPDIFFSSKNHTRGTTSPTPAASAAASSSSAASSTTAASSATASDPKTLPKFLRDSIVLLTVKNDSLNSLWGLLVNLMEGETVRRALWMLKKLLPLEASAPSRPAVEISLWLVHDCPTNTKDATALASLRIPLSLTTDTESSTDSTSAGIVRTLLTFARLFSGTVYMSAIEVSTLLSEPRMAALRREEKKLLLDSLLKSKPRDMVSIDGTGAEYLCAFDSRESLGSMTDGIRRLRDVIRASSLGSIQSLFACVAQTSSSKSSQSLHRQQRSATFSMTNCVVNRELLEEKLREIMTRKDFYQLCEDPDSGLQRYFSFIQAGEIVSFEQFASMMAVVQDSYAEEEDPTGDDSDLIPSAPAQLIRTKSLHEDRGNGNTVRFTTSSPLASYLALSPTQVTPSNSPRDDDEELDALLPAAPQPLKRQVSLNSQKQSQENVIIAERTIQSAKSRQAVISGRHLARVSLIEEDLDRLGALNSIGTRTPVTYSTDEPAGVAQAIPSKSFLEPSVTISDDGVIDLAFFNPGFYPPSSLSRANDVHSEGCVTIYPRGVGLITNNIFFEMQILSSGRPSDGSLDNDSSTMPLPATWISPAVAIGIVPVESIGSFPGVKANRGSKPADLQLSTLEMGSTTTATHSDRCGLFLTVLQSSDHSKLNLGLMTDGHLIAICEKSGAPVVVEVGDRLGCSMIISKNNVTRVFGLTINFYIRSSSPYWVADPVLICSVPFTPTGGTSGGSFPVYAPVVWLQKNRRIMREQLCLKYIFGQSKKKISSDAEKRPKSKHHIHGLLRVTTKRALTASCDVCREKGSCVYYCAQCDWDICYPCFSGATPAPPTASDLSENAAAELPSEESKVHMEIDVPAAPESKNQEQAAAGASLVPSDDITSLEAKAEVAVAVPVGTDKGGSDDKVPLCENGHKMKMSDYCGGGYRNGWVCNDCRKNGNSARWLCLPCNDDYCFKCRPALAGGIDSVSLEGGDLDDSDAAVSSAQRAVAHTPVTLKECVPGVPKGLQCLVHVLEEQAKSRVEQLVGKVVKLIRVTGDEDVLIEERESNISLARIPSDEAPVTVSRRSYVVKGSSSNTTHLIGSCVLTTGKWFFECALDFAQCTNARFGWADASVIANGISQPLGDEKGTWAYDIQKRVSLHDVGKDWGQGICGNDVIGVAVDADHGLVAFSHNGAWDGGMGAAFLGAEIVNGLVPAISLGSLRDNKDAIMVNFGEGGVESFSFPPPEGFAPVAAWFAESGDDDDDDCIDSSENDATASAGEKPQGEESIAVALTDGALLDSKEATGSWTMRALTDRRKVLVLDHTLSLQLLRSYHSDRVLDAMFPKGGLMLGSSSGLSTVAIKGPVRSREDSEQTTVDTSPTDLLVGSSPDDTSTNGIEPATVIAITESTLVVSSLKTLGDGFWCLGVASADVAPRWASGVSFADAAAGGSAVALMNCPATWKASRVLGAVTPSQHSDASDSADCSARSTRSSRSPNQREPQGHISARSSADFDGGLHKGMSMFVVADPKGVDIGHLSSNRLRAEVGARVMRGPDWRYGNQDGESAEKMLTRVNFSRIFKRANLF